MKNIELNINNNCIFDRSLIDIFVFTSYQFYNQKITKKTFDFMYKNLFHYYDKINSYYFYLPITFKIENSKNRLLDEKYRKKLENLFYNIIEVMNFYKNNIFVIESKNVNDRINEIKEILKYRGVLC